MNNMNESPTIKEIRETRKKISSRFGHSIDKLVDHYLAKQKSLAPKSLKRLLPELKVGAKKSCATSVR
jgi:hypothetical protein